MSPGSLRIFFFFTFQLWDNLKVIFNSSIYNVLCLVWNCSRSLKNITATLGLTVSLHLLPEDSRICVCTTLHDPTSPDYSQLDQRYPAEANLANPILSPGSLENEPKENWVHLSGHNWSMEVQICESATFCLLCAPKEQRRGVCRGQERDKDLPGGREKSLTFSFSPSLGSISHLCILSFLLFLERLWVLIFITEKPNQHYSIQNLLFNIKIINM